MVYFHNRFNYRHELIHNFDTVSIRESQFAKKIGFVDCYFGYKQTWKTQHKCYLRLSMYCFSFTVWHKSI